MWNISFTEKHFPWIIVLEWEFYLLLFLFIYIYICGVFKRPPSFDNL